MSLSLWIHHPAPVLDLEVTLPAGVITALVGPSGSGKNSVLRCIAGLLRPERGRITVTGAVWTDSARGVHLPTRLRPIGLAPQHYALFPHLTAESNVAMALGHLPRAARRAQTRACLALTHLADLAARYPHELSGGQRQRVALARAIAREPQVLLLDEPFSAVDRATRKGLYRELRQLQARLGVTTLLVTHDLEEAAQLAPHLILLDQGRAVQAGPTAEVLTRPASLAAARLLDIPNCFMARLAPPAAGQPPALLWGPHRLRLPPEVPSLSRSDPWCSFAILPHNVLLVHPDKPEGSHLENPIAARVETIISLGGEALVWLIPAGLPKERLQARLPLRAIQRHRVQEQGEVRVCLRPGDLLVLT